MKSLSAEQVEQIRQLAGGRDKFDAIVAFGYGPVQVSATPNSYKLNLYGRINAIATGMLYQSLHIKTIIPTGGKTGGSDKPSEAALLARFIQSKFTIPESVFILEEEAMDTINNVVYVANIIDRSPHDYQNLLFVAMDFHLPRIQEICTLVSLNGCCVAAEAIVKLRSERHKQSLLKLLHPGNSSYVTMLENQERGMRGIRNIPQYWLPPMGALNNTQRLREILSLERVKSVLNSHQLDTTSVSAEQLHRAIRSIPRQFPD
ncbi:MAG: hypothetical protein Fur006_15910 [Coleofasciculaceae cyanobacterium]